MENRRIGAIVGEFNATDPDANATLTFSLVSGAGDDNNSLFSLDENGTLRTATTFNFESNVSTYSIRVRVTDENNAKQENNFTVTLMDWFDHRWNKVTSLNKSSNRIFGFSISQSGNFLAVGAILADPGNTNNAGAAYIYNWRIMDP